MGALAVAFLVGYTVVVLWSAVREWFGRIGGE